MNTQVSSTDQEGHEQEQNQKVGQRSFDLIQDLQKPENMKGLKGMLKNRAWEDTLGLPQEMNKTYQNVRDELLVQDGTVKSLKRTILDSREQFRTLKTKYQNLKKHLTDLQKVIP